MIIQIVFHKRMKIYLEIIIQTTTNIMTNKKMIILFKLKKINVDWMLFVFLLMKLLTIFYLGIIFNIIWNICLQDVYYQIKHINISCSKNPVCNDMKIAKTI